MKAADAVAAAVGATPDALFVSSLGTATSALRLASNDGAHLYLGGAMGCGLAAALGVADCRPDRGVVAIVGDGDLLMGASSLWTLSGLAPKNLLLLVLDDGRYSITGGQELVDAGAFRGGRRCLPGTRGSRGRHAVGGRRLRAHAGAARDPARPHRRAGMARPEPVRESAHDPYEFHAERPGRLS